MAKKTKEQLRAEYEKAKKAGKIKEAGVGTILSSAAKLAIKAAKGIENQKYKKMEADTTAFAKVARAVAKGEDPVKAAKSLNKKLSKGTIETLRTAKYNDAPLLSRSQLAQISGKSKISPKAIAENIAKKKDKPKVATPSSVRTKDGVFTVSKTPTGKVKVTDPKGKSTKLPRGKTAQSYFTNQRPR